MSTTDAACPLSIVMPAFNEADHIELSVTEWFDTVVATVPGAELVVVDDCSRDDTFVRLQTLAIRLPALRVLQTPVNMGHGPALRMGLEACRGEFVFQTDSDRQHTPEDFPAFWQRRHDADLLVGVRTTRADGAVRRVVSGVMRGINLLLWQVWITDANCPFKLMNRRLVGAVLPAVPQRSFIPMVMLCMLARKAGFRVLSLPVQHFPRRAGQQSLAGLARWARVGPQCALELLRLRMSVSALRSRASRAGARPAAS
jgi:dolichol-phosphate mannosyltransferase